MRVNVYVDGFNLYYRALRSTRYKWLNVRRLAELYLGSVSRASIHRLRYFTAEVNARPHDPDQPVRQQTYLRALRTLPNLTIHLGHFSEQVEWRQRADGQGTIRVVVSDEKMDAVGHPKFYKKLRMGPIEISQFPSEMGDASGTFHRPTSW